MTENRGWEREPLQLERAEYAAPAAGGLTCTSCRQPFAGAYYEAAGQVVCEVCSRKLQAQQATGAGPVTFAKAALLGTGAAILGGAAWWAVRHFTGYELGLLAVGVGFLVGAAVRAGSGGRGGVAFQVLAVFLVYSGIVFNYAPDLIEAIREGGAAEQEPAAAAADEAPADAAVAPRQNPPPTAADRVVAMATLVGWLYAVPFLGGAKNIIGILIIAFALWEAWKMNRRVPLAITGPYDPARAREEASSSVG